MATESAGPTLKKLYCADLNVSTQRMTEDANLLSSLQNPNIAEQAGEFYSVEVILRKGLGLVAAKDLVRGRQILEEAPMITYNIDTMERALVQLPNRITEASLESRIREIPEEMQKIFYSLHNAKDDATSHTGRLLTNALQFDDHEKGVFPIISRANHSCNPNCQFSWNPLTMKGALYCIKKTFKGEELTVAYSHDGPTYMRQPKLRENYGFLCQCEICDQNGPDLNASNQRHLQILQLTPMINDATKLYIHPEEALTDVYDLLKIYEGEDITDSRIATCLRRAFDIHIAHNDLARAQFFGERMYQETVVCRGPDHPLALEMKDLMETPETSSFYGLSQHWATAKRDVPELLEGERDFEQWLWARTGVTDTESFPPIHIDYIS